MPSLCAYFDRGHCRSCASIELDYAAQLARKQQAIREALAFAGPFTMEEAVGSPTLGFRDRAKLSVTGTVAAPVLGLLGDPPGTLDDGRELLSCPIHHPRLNELLQALPALITLHGVAPYRIAERAGELKGVIAFRSATTGQMYLRWVLRSRAAVEAVRAMVPELTRRFADLASVSVNLQPIAHAILEGPEELYLTERRAIEHRVGEVTLQLSPQAFVQTNGDVAARLYAVAAAWVAESRPSRALELFCGQGAFSFAAAASAGQWLGIEVNREAVDAARRTAREQDLAHLEFECLDAGDAAQTGARMAAFDPALILVNPPRRGLGGALPLIARARPREIIYSSCALDTLAADLMALAGDYRLERARLFDMFAHTEHFETLARIVRKA